MGKDFGDRLGQEPAVWPASNLGWPMPSLRAGAKVMGWSAKVKDSRHQRVPSGEA